VLYDHAPFSTHVFTSRDGLAAELASKFSVPLPSAPPPKMPPPDKSCCGSPLFK